MNHFWQARNRWIAGFSFVGILVHLILRFLLQTSPSTFNLPLFFIFVCGGLPLLIDLVKKILQKEWGSDLLAGISIVAAVCLGEYLAGSIVVLMLSGGAVLEAYAVDTATSVLKALSKRAPTIGHRKEGTHIIDIAIADICVGDTLVVLPHEISPVDGAVLEGHGVMDESYLTGEPFQMSKAPGSLVMSGAINGENALTIRANKLAIDSRYAKIMEVVRHSEADRPKIRRLGDQLGALYTPVALVLALAAWVLTGHVSRFLAVLVVATPCPLIIAIPIAVMGSISLCARRGILIKKPAVLEQIRKCQTIIFDKTGTLTYGLPTLTDQEVAPGFEAKEIFAYAVSLERYSKHPLANAVIKAAEKMGVAPLDVNQLSEKPGEGLFGMVAGRGVSIVGRKLASHRQPSLSTTVSAEKGGLECFIFVDNTFAALYRFRDEARAESSSFISHLGPKHQFTRQVLLSGDRESEVKYLAEKVGIKEVYGGKSPEEKLTIVKKIMESSKSVYVGDGINDAPALLASTVGIVMGHNSDITTEAAGAVIMENSLEKVDELMHIGARMRAIALQSALTGMALSLVGMIFAAYGHLSPVQGAITQEIIDLIVIANALRTSLLPKSLIDFERT